MVARFSKLVCRSEEFLWKLPSDLDEIASQLHAAHVRISSSVDGGMHPSASVTAMPPLVGAYVLAATSSTCPTTQAPVLRDRHDAHSGARAKSRVVIRPSVAPHLAMATQLHPLAFATWLRSGLFCLLRWILGGALRGGSLFACYDTCSLACLRISCL